MSKITTITDSDGKKSVIETRQTGSTGCLWVLLVLFLIGAPAAYFPTWLAVIAYIVEGLMAIAFIATKLGWNPNKEVEK
jgi:hypothetical protein